MQPYCGNIMSIKISYVRKDASTLLVLSAAIALLLMGSSPLVLSNPLLQPAQATTILPTSMQTRIPVKLGTSCSDANATLTFVAKGNGDTLTNGTFRIANGSSGQILWSGDLFRANSQEGVISLDYGVRGNDPVCGIGSGNGLEIQTGCESTTVALTTDGGDIRHFPAVVNCEFPFDTTAQSSSPSMTGTTTAQDSDADGIPDSSDRCTHNTNHRCFKEGDISESTTSSTTQQQQSSSMAGNQTR
jgi:hypothetical protein